MAKLLCILLTLLTLTACGSEGVAVPSSTPTSGAEEAASSPQPPPESSSHQKQPALKITVEGHELWATFEENSSAQAFQELLIQGPVTIQMEDYGGFEKVGPLGTELVRNDTQITTVPGDVILYQGNQITLYYRTNTWTFTRLARIDDPTNLEEILGNEAVSVTFSLN